MFLGAAGLLFLIPLPAPGTWRIVAHLPDQPVDDDKPITPGLLERLVAARTGMTFQIREVGWTSRFSPTYGVVQTLRTGRVFLAGDAAHVHSPVGGQGMNFGIQDAQNLV